MHNYIETFLQTVCAYHVETKNNINNILQFRQQILMTLIKLLKVEILLQNKNSQHTSTRCTIYSKSQQISINVLVYIFSIMWTLRAYKILSYLSYRPRKHCQRGRFCVAKSESLEPNNLAKSRTTANRSSPSLLYEEKRHNEGSCTLLPK